MSELVIVVSDLYLAAGALMPSSDREQLPGLSRLARYGAAERLPHGWRAWLAAWLGRGDLAAESPAAIAAAGVPPLGGEPSTPAGFVWLAEPLHLTPSLTSVHLSPHGLLRLDAATQEELCRAFNATFAELGYGLAPARAGRLLARGAAPAGPIETTDPARCLGATLAEALPRGRAAGALRRLGTEIEMWLHEHPINRRRLGLSRLPISTLWLWGGGPRRDPRIERPARADAPRSAAVFSDDPYVEGLSQLLRAPCARAARTLAGVGAPGAPRIVATLELFARQDEPTGAERSNRATTATRALEAFDRDWLVPALDQLARGSLSRCTLVANDRRVSLASRDRWKLWRRPRAALAVLAHGGAVP
ncbi:MAG TPA: hypothetical protein VMD03_10020 [Steroidobacteraceae bacterium]|nr:hypothetical protein [Steroidobacteraceae bacterium]